MSIRKKLLAVALATATTIGTAGVAAANADAEAVRLAGVDRYATAMDVAEESFGQSTLVLVASGEQFPDALASAYLSGAADAPLLLTPSAGLPSEFLPLLEELGVDGVQILGGTAAVSDEVKTQIESGGYTTDRIAGADRYATAAAVAQVLPKEAIGTFGAGRAAILATGASFADALAAAPISGAQNLPILLTTSDTLHPAASAALDALDIDQVVISGGTAAVSETVATQVAAKGIAVRRVAGENRQATARALADLAVDELDFTEQRVMLSRGDAFPDALVGGPRGAKLEVPILVIESSNSLGASARDYIDDRKANLAAIDVLGGTAAISDAVANEAVAVARS